MQSVYHPFTACAPATDGAWGEERELRRQGTVAGLRYSCATRCCWGLRTPVLFVQGSRDPLCPLDLLEKVRARMTVSTTLLVVPGGDHSLVVSAKQLRTAGETQDDVDTRVLAAVTRFVTANS